MTVVTVVIPTVEGREEYLKRCLRGYQERTDDRLEIIVERRDTCGQAWQAGAEQASGDYLHFTADDIVPGEGWLPPLIEAVEQGCVPVPLVVTAAPDVLDDEDMPHPWNPLTPVSNYFERQGGPDVIADWYRADGLSEYPSVPFCSLGQWREIGPMIASHYGTDKWFGMKAKRVGIPCAVRHGTHFYHYAAHAGRIPQADGWLHLDRLNFELNIAFHSYANGSLPEHKVHPDYGTPQGRQMARDWYASNVAGPRYWEAPDVEEQYR